LTEIDRSDYNKDAEHKSAAKPRNCKRLAAKQSGLCDDERAIIDKKGIVMSKETENKDKNNRPDDPELESVLEQIEELQDELDDKDENKAQQKPEKEKPKSKKTKDDCLKDEYDELNDRFLRLAAEYDNYRKRSEKEKQSSVSYGITFAVEHMLPVLDVIETAAAAESSDEEYKKGVEMTVAMFKAAFETLGITEIEAEGKKFDPEFHCAVAQEKKEDAENGDIVTVIQKGYKLDDKVIRHSMVTVAS